MPKYFVEAQIIHRELYAIEANSEQEARQRVLEGEFDEKDRIDTIINPCLDSIVVYKTLDDKDD